MKVIGTAGHIDHGKSTLVHRLTGIDPDRLEEEKRRGMTIDLGFAWLTLPSGTDVSIVDVPGHERFVKNMLAGTGGIDVALLVVAADEAVMPQTREHVDIMNLLHIRHGVVALTKADLVDDELRELAINEVEDGLRGTTLEGSAIVPVSSVTGEGIEALLAELDRAVAVAPEREDRGLPYVPVDRVFTLPGFGTVITGTLHDGVLSIGQEIEVLPSGLRARVRGLQTHREHVDRAYPGARVALNVAGVTRSDIARGDILTIPGTVHTTRRLDARLEVLPSAPFALSHGVRVAVHIHAAEREATLSLLDADTLEAGKSGWVQLRFDDPIPVIRSQRFIVRLPAPARTVAGGEVVDVAPRHRRSDAAALSKLVTLGSRDPEKAVIASLPSAHARTPEQLALTLGMPPDEVRGMLMRLETQGSVVRVGNAYMSTKAMDTVADRIREHLAQYHTTHSMERGMPAEELRSRLGWQSGHWQALLEDLEKKGTVRRTGGLLASPDHVGGTKLRPEDANRILSALEREPFSPPTVSQLLQSVDAGPELLAAMAAENAVVRLSDEVVLARSAYEEMVTRILALIRDDGSVTVARVRDEFDTSRKYALALLEYLDGRRVTKRVGDTRVTGTRAATCA